MDYVDPRELVGLSLASAEKKAALPARDLLIRSFLAGSILSFATSLAFVVTSQGLPPIVGAILFPVGFVMLVLLGLELATGNFALLPAAIAAGRLSTGRAFRNLLWVYLGNLAGSLFYAFLFYVALGGTSGSGGSVAELLKAAALRKTVAYAALGMRGWEIALVKGLLCNWMVTLGVLLALVSRSTMGKIAAMWLPIVTFFAQGFEHSIVNMFVIPEGKLLGAPISLRDWWLWNQLPVTLGNLVSGALLTGLALYFTYQPRKAAVLRLDENVAALGAESIEPVSSAL
jgi:formate/nitrite transporter